MEREPHDAEWDANESGTKQNIRLNSEDKHKAAGNLKIQGLQRLYAAHRPAGDKSMSG